MNTTIKRLTDALVATLPLTLYHLADALSQVDDPIIKNAALLLSGVIALYRKKPTDNK